jgi:hypothetical protein
LDGSGKRAAGADSGTSGSHERQCAKRERSWRQFAQQRAHLIHHGRRGTAAVGRSHEELDAAQIFLLQPERLANTALEAVAIDRESGVLAGNENAQSRGARNGRSDKERVAVEAAPRALAKQALELRLLAQPARGIESETLSRRYCGYSPMRRRPRARRRRSTSRPPRVRLRTRNPWRRARRVFDGW